MILLENIVADMEAEDAEMTDPEIERNNGEIDPYQIRELDETIIKFAGNIARRYAPRVAMPINADVEDLTQELKQEALVAAAKAAGKYDPSRLGRSGLPATFNSFIYNQMRYAVLNYCKEYYDYHENTRSVEDYRDNTEEDDEGTGNLYDNTADESVPDPREQVASSELRNSLDEVIKELPPKLRKYIELRYGMGERYGRGEIPSNTEVARIMGISPAYGKRLEMAAMMELRKKLMGVKSAMMGNTPEPQKNPGETAIPQEKRSLAGYSDEELEPILSKLSPEQRSTLEQFYAIGSRRGQPRMSKAEIARGRNTASSSVSMMLKRAENAIQKLLVND